jgi:D-glycero-D-manno-heptose 1,7-bisphosphate phosphatase
MESNPKLIVLDRDGVINHDSDEFVKNLSEFVFIPGSIEAIARLSQAGFFIAVATNQSGLARGLVLEDELHKMHQSLFDAVKRLGGKIEMVAFCPHGPDAACDCRKPQPGLLKTISAELNIPLDHTVVVGDSYRDLESAWAVGASAVLVLTGKGERTLQAHPELKHTTPIYNDLAGFAVDFLKGASA